MIIALSHSFPCLWIWINGISLANSSRNESYRIASVKIIQSFFLWLLRIVERGRERVHKHIYIQVWAHITSRYIYHFLIRLLEFAWEIFVGLVRTQSFAVLLASFRCSVFLIYVCVFVCVTVRLVTARDFVSVRRVHNVWLVQMKKTSNKRICDDHNNRHQRTKHTLITHFDFD